MTANTAHSEQLTGDSFTDLSKLTTQEAIEFAIQTRVDVDALGESVQRFKFMNWHRVVNLFFIQWISVVDTVKRVHKLEARIEAMEAEIAHLRAANDARQGGK